MHNSKRGSPKTSYKDFIERYNIPIDRRIKKKYETIINGLIKKHYEERLDTQKKVQ